MTHIVLHNYLPRRRRATDALKDKPTSELKFALGVGKAGLKIWNKRDPQYKKVIEGLKALEVELRRRGEKVEDPLGDSQATEQINKFGSLDYMANMHHFKAEAEWPDGTKTHLFLMAPTIENAKKQFKAQVNAGGWSRITGIKAAQVRPEPR